MSDETNTYTGQCYCGATKVSVEGDPMVSGFCHCASCRSFHGAPFIGWSVWPSDKVHVTGQMNKTDKVDHLARATCAKCGGKMMGIIKGADMTVVFPNVLAASGAPFHPAWHQFYAERVIDIVDGVSKFIDKPADHGGSGETLSETGEALGATG